MANSFTDSRRDLRERAFQALFNLEFGGEYLATAQFAYTYDKTIEEGGTINVPVFLLNLIKGVQDFQSEVDQQIKTHLESGWSLKRLALVDRALLRLGLYEIRYFEETPERVAVNEIIKIAKEYLDDISAKFVSGLLSRSVIE